MYFYYIKLEDRRVKGNIALKMKRSRSGAYKCCYPTCSIRTNLSVPSRAIQYDVLAKFNFFILDTSKVCINHSNVDRWNDINSVATLNAFTSKQIDRAIQILQNPKPQQVSFSSN